MVIEQQWNYCFQVGNTALMYAAYGNHPHCCNELLLRGADVTATNMFDDTAFSLACDNNSNLGKVNSPLSDMILIVINTIFQRKP